MRIPRPQTEFAPHPRGADRGTPDTDPTGAPDNDGSDCRSAPVFGSMHVSDDVPSRYWEAMSGGGAVDRFLSRPTG
jgi:hypothetical protein